MRGASVYQRLGWRLLPLHDVAAGVCSCGKPQCPSAGKHPRIADWPTAATDDPATLAGWAAQWPDANLGAATGEGSGFFVLDVDPDKGGAVSLAALVADHGDLPETVQAQTGSGGTHYLFKALGGISNSAGKLGRGLDIRGEGGQIVIATSVSAKGVYRWINAPWSTPIAEAPAWLINRTLSAVAPHLSDRGSFPPATQAVLDAAACALERHGPAAQGDGGDAHTFVAAAILVHDFALTEAEAWPLLVDWNATGSPEWSDADLAAKMRGGGKYASGAYGGKRTMDALERGRKLINDHVGTGADPFDLIDKAKEIQFTDRGRASKFAKELSAEVGVSVRDLDMPGVHVEVKIPEGTINVTTRIHEVANESIAVIAPEVFQRNGVLCEVVKAERVTFISDLETTRIQDLMSQKSKFCRTDDKGLVAQAAPLTIAAVLHSRRTHDAVRVLEAVTTAPIFLADGSILQARGYNAQARVFLEPSVSVDVPDEPTHADAVAVGAVFQDLLCDFAFAEPADFSSWLAGLLSPLVKAATSNAPAPLICVSASSPGAGKTLLIDIASRIITGGAAEVRPYNPRDPSEWGKRLTAFIKAASPVSVFDNCNGPIGDEGLDRLITSSTWSDRILGASDAPALPNVTTWLATGNNIEPQGDTVRRVLLCRIEVMTERPQERHGFKRPELADYALEHRSELLSAALTLLRAYHCAGRPVQRLPSWGSFTAWSQLIRGAITWSGLADPFLTQQRASNDLNEPENDAHDFWIDVVGASDGIAASIVLEANRADAMSALGLRSSITAHGLKPLIGRFVDKPRDGKRIRKDTDSRRHQTSYYVETISGHRV